MFVFQVGMQKNAPQEGQAFKQQVEIFTGKDAQRLLKAVGPACEQMLLKVHGV
ncbi:MAG: hypothetical protein WC861_03815 [Candidatus Micrarchaeia archaeon]|jgi:hypothetical protein